MKIMHFKLWIYIKISGELNESDSLYIINSLTNDDCWYYIIFKNKKNNVRMISWLKDPKS